MKRAALAVAPLVLVLAGCGGSSNSTAFTPNLTLGVDLTSASNNLKTLNGGSVTAGWNQLVGSATSGGSTYNVELLATVTYTSGSGPFTGVVSVTYPDGSMVSMKMDGYATYDAGTSTTKFTSNLTVLGGTTSHTGAKGVGAFTGYRNVALGGPVHLDIQAAIN